MLRMLTYFIIGLFLVACTPLGTGESGLWSPRVTSRPGWTIHTEPSLDIVFQLPEEWQRIERNGAPYEFEGQDGYASFTDSFISPTNFNETVEELCQKELEFANAKYQELGQKPYGENPQIIKAQVDQQPACFILPSADQDEHFERKSILFTRYPPGLALKPEQLRFLNMVVDKDHVQSIAETIHFVPRETDQSIEPLPQASPFAPMLLGNLKLESQRVISMALDESYLYWTVYEEPGVIYRTPLEGGDIEKFITSRFEGGEVMMMPPIREGDWLIYLDNSISSKDKNWELHAKNLRDEEDRVVIAGSGDLASAPVPFISADGSWVAWTRTANNAERSCVESIIGLSNLHTGEQVELDRVCIDQYMWSIVSLSYPYLVAEQDLPDAKGGKNNLYLFDLNDGHREALVKNGYSSMPRISYPWIIWKNALRFNWGYSDSIYDLSNEKQHAVVVPGETPPDPNLEGHWLYWVIKANTRNEESSIYLYDLEREQVWKMTTPGKDVFSAAAINGNTIAWSRRSDFQSVGDSVLEWGTLP